MKHRVGIIQIQIKLLVKGKLDVMEDSELPGSALITVTAENRLIDLDRPKRRTYTPEDQKVLYSTDSFFDEVAALQKRNIDLKST